MGLDVMVTRDNGDKQRNVKHQRQCPTHMLIILGEQGEKEGGGGWG